MERSIPRRAEDALVPATTALLMWDLVKGLAGHATNLHDLAPAWRVLLAAARRHGVLVVWSKHVAPTPRLMDDAEVWRLMRRQGVQQQEDLKPFMQRGSVDTEFLEGFEPADDELVLEKATPSIFVGTAADARLRAAGIRTLVLAGVATDIGIEFSARHALALGYFPVVAEDAVGSYNDVAHARGIACLGAFAFVERAETIVTAWKRASAT